MFFQCGLDHIILRALFLLFAVVVLVYVIVVLYPLSFNAVSYNGFAFPYSSSLQDKSDNLLFIILRRSLRIVGGWLSTLIKHCITDLISTYSVQVIKHGAKNFGYSLKNIPMPSKSKYLKYMVEKVESFVRRLRWKAYHFCKEYRENGSDHCKNVGFKTVATPPQNEDLNVFENGMYDMIRNIEFTNIRNEFLDHLNKDIESIRSSKYMLVFAGKSTKLILIIL